MKYYSQKRAKNEFPVQHTKTNNLAAGGSIKLKVRIKKNNNNKQLHIPLNEKYSFKFVYYILLVIYYRVTLTLLPKEILPSKT